MELRNRIRGGRLTGTRQWAAILLLTIAALVTAPVTEVALAQDTGLRRENGVIFTKGSFVEMTAGAAIAANEAVYLTTTASEVRKLPTSGNRDTVFGVAPFACTAAQTTCIIQISGKATVIADAAVTVGSRVGAPTATAGRVRSVTTDNPSYVLGRALTAATSAGDTFTILLERSTPGVVGIERDVILCGDLANSGTNYMGPATGYAAGIAYDAGLTASDLSYKIAGTGCAALDNATEATADEVLFANNTFHVLGLQCTVSGSGSNGVTLNLRSAAANLTPDVTVTIATGNTTGATVTSSTTAVAAGATFALRAITTEDLSAQDAWCVARILILP